MPQSSCIGKSNFSLVYKFLLPCLRLVTGLLLLRQYVLILLCSQSAPEQSQDVTQRQHVAKCYMVAVPESCTRLDSPNSFLDDSGLFLPKCIDVSRSCQPNTHAHDWPFAAFRVYKLTDIALRLSIHLLKNTPSNSSTHLFPTLRELAFERTTNLGATG